ncbi:hypothetical protein PFISCL1PPCAC_12914, partial [Pristionchus fissidentatus]
MPCCDWCRDCCDKFCPQCCRDLCRRICGEDCGDCCCCICCILCIAAVIAFLASAVFGCCSFSSILSVFAVVAIGSLGVAFLAKSGSCCPRPAKMLELNPKKDVVYLYQFLGTPTSSSMCPFCIKVEAFCRLHGITVERRNTLTKRGANNLLPFIELNGERHSDSQIIVKRLAQIFNKNAYPDEQ